jgi:hypothetical protein
MYPTLSFVALSVVALSLGSAGAACVPFPGGNTGCLPPSKPIESCESKAAGNAGKLVKAILVCHRKQVDLLFAATPFDEEGCEATAKARFDAKTVITGCPCVEKDELLSVAASLSDTYNNLNYCAGGVPIGGDDTGYVPPDKDVLKCEDTIQKRSATLVKAIIACRQKTAKAHVTGTSFDPSACDAALFAKFAASSDTSGCGCVSPTAIQTLVTTELSVGNDYFYCASPSGAFLKSTDAPG